VTPQDAASMWHLHDGTEAMYQDPMGRRTPLMVVRVHNQMATVEFASGNTGRVSLRRVVAPRVTEYEQHFEHDGGAWRHKGPKLGIVHNGMPAFFDAIKNIMEPKS
jgi:hypothetical protein